MLAQSTNTERILNLGTPRVHVTRLTILLLLLLASCALAQPLGLMVSHGDLPVVIVAGHGGDKNLDKAQVRDPKQVGDPHYVPYADAFTNALAERLAAALTNVTGHSPSLILSLIHRRFVDLNRSPTLASQDPTGQAFHTAYHQAITDELSRLHKKHGFALLLDIHGQIHYPTTLMLGTAKNTTISSWSRETLWGSKGLVDSLKDAGFSVLPETQEGYQRYGGGYTIRHHGQDLKIEAWQMEHSRALRLSPKDQEHYAAIVAAVLARALSAPPSDLNPSLFSP